MRQLIPLLSFSLLLFGSCLASKTTPASAKQPDTLTYEVQLDTLTLVDSSRNRTIPLALYQPVKAKGKLPVVIFSHGYGLNQGGDYLHYSYLTNFLASNGYFVASIQHELPTDSLMPLTGIAQIVRRPFWDRGVATILFVLNTLKQTHPELDFEHVTLIGHSNGGDMSALFPLQHPGIAKVITLDNRRVTLPRMQRPKTYSLRSSDQPADEGVLPTPREAKRFGITVIKLPNTIHNDMDDDGTPEQQQEINNYLLSFLRE